MTHRFHWLRVFFFFPSVLFLIDECSLQARCSLPGSGWWLFLVANPHLDPELEDFASLGTEHPGGQREKVKPRTVPAVDRDASAFDKATVAGFKHPRGPGETQDSRVWK